MIALAPLEFDCSWPVPRTLPPLPDAEIHLWCAHLNRASDEHTRFAEVLSAEEHERAQRFHFAVDRSRFIVRRSLLRLLLGHYVGEDPARLRITAGAYGKPELAGPSAASGLRFNLSDSGDVALYAFVRAHEVGIDIERLRPGAERDAISQRFFSPAEYAALKTVAADDKERAFFNCWTRKEAFLKANGEGLFRPLDSFDVTVAPDEPARLLAVHGPGPAASEWSLYHLEPCAGFVGALAIRGKHWRVARWQMDRN